jgi:hypothetical protein
MLFETKINEAKNNAQKKDRTCIYGGCTDKAIKSHVLQKNGILKEISEDNHLIQLVTPNAFNLVENGMLEFKKIGINDAYTFMGFCNKHDTELFKPIEDKNNIDYYNIYHQALFSYRGLCQEIRRKEISTEWLYSLKDDMPIHMKEAVSDLIDGSQIGIKNLYYFKGEFENSFTTQDFNKFTFSTIEFPRIELCISVPLNLGEVGNPQKLSFDDWKRQYPKVFSTSFINVFPVKDKSYFIGGYHKDYPCNWTAKKINKFGYSKSKIIKKELSDFIVLRLEFWVMSQKLFRMIPEDTILKYKKTFSNNVWNHSENLKTKINLFEKV